MFKADRHAKIKELLLQKAQADVQTLSAILNVSAVTVRSDLEELEKEGFLIRTHGGAVLNHDQESTHEDRICLPFPEISNVEAKSFIAQIAGYLIKENEWIFIGPGTTCFLIAQELISRENLNIITNNLYASVLFTQNKSINVIVTGGDLHHSNQCMEGEMFQHSLRNINVSKAFLSVDGIDIEGGFTVSDTCKASVYKTVSAVAKEIVFVADYTKFDKISFMKIADIKTADTVITNEKVGEHYKDFFFKNEIKLFTAYKSLSVAQD
jgi:DeoR family fructose operon transcriptional repressor